MASFLTLEANRVIFPSSPDDGMNWQSPSYILPLPTPPWLLQRHTTVSSQEVHRRSSIHPGMDRQKNNHGQLNDFSKESSSVQFSRSVMSNSLQAHGLQHARLSCPSPTLEFTQTHVHWVGDAIQPSHPLSSPSPPAFNLSQHQGLFKWVSSSHQVAKVLEFQLQHQSFQWIFRTNFL